MRILVLGEGPNDLGRAAADGSLSHAGPIPIFVERLVKEVAPTLQLETAVMPWKNVRGHRDTGFDRKLLHAFGIYGRNVAGVVGVADRDGSHNWTRASQLEAGAQSLADHGIPTAVGLNVEMLEATLLADEMALRAALGDRSIECQPDPESRTSLRRGQRPQSEGQASALGCSIASVRAFHRLQRALCSHCAPMQSSRSRTPLPIGVPRLRRVRARTCISD